MKDITIANVPESLIEQLESRARARRCTLNTEIMCLLELAVKTEQNEQYDARELMAEANKLRRQTGGAVPTLLRHPTSWGAKR